VDPVTAYEHPGSISRQGCNAFCRSRDRVERDEGFFWKLSLGLEDE